MGSRLYATLTIIPEDVDYNMGAMGKDHGQADRTQSQLLATAVVAKASMNQMLCYEAVFPAEDPAKVLNFFTWFHAKEGIFGL